MYPFDVVYEKLYRSHGVLRYLSTILIKDFRLFKITESVFSLYIKLYNFKQVKVFYLNSRLHYLSTMKTL